MALSMVPQEQMSLEPVAATSTHPENQLGADHKLGLPRNKSLCSADSIFKSHLFYFWIEVSGHKDQLTPAPSVT